MGRSRPDWHRDRWLERPVDAAVFCKPRLFTRVNMCMQRGGWLRWQTLKRSCRLRVWTGIGTDG